MIVPIMNDLGYRTSSKQSDVRKGAVIAATNFVYHTAAREHPKLDLRQARQQLLPCMPHVVRYAGAIEK